MHEVETTGGHTALDAGRFDPDNAAASWTLPSHWYHEPEIYRREQEAIFYRSWWYLCHLSDLPDPGDYHCGSVADQGVFVIRDRDGSIRGARGRDALRNGDPESANPRPVRIETYGGFIFVNLDPDAAPLAEQAPQFLRDMYACCPRLDELVHVERREFDVAANWKTVVDNNHECYHCAANHKSLMQLVDYETKATWADDGITFSHKVERKEADNGAYKLDEAALTQDSLFGYIWPVHVPLFFPGTPSMVMFQILPTGPETARMRHDYFLLNHEASEQERSFIDWFSGVLAPEDIALCESVQKGLHSRGYQQGKFVVDPDHVEISEHHVHFFQQFVYRALTA